MAKHKDLFIDIETYSSVDIKSCGSYKYIESPDFEILIIGYAFDDEDVQVIDLAQGEEMPDEFAEALFDEDIKKHAHNAVFERNAFKRVGYDIPIEQWYCTLVKSAYCGLPLGLDQVSKVLDLQDKKLDTGKALIKYFSCPCKPTKINGMRTRNYPWDAPEKWEMYKTYNKYDVLSEREIYYRLSKYSIPPFERSLYILDQHINDRGILVDKELAESAIAVDEQYTQMLMDESKSITMLDNPNSVAQLKKWYIANYADLVDATLSMKDIEYLKTANGQFYDKANQSMAADAIKMLLKLDAVQDIPELRTVLENRQKLGRSSVKKYYTMMNCAMKDGRVRGTFQFYGANRTGRWAGRLVQLQNLSKNHVENIDLPRELIRKRDWDTVNMIYGDVSDILSQLVRTTFIAPKGMLYSVADFSAIEARVVSWLADEEWRMDVFRGDGKIYEAAGARMFNVPIEAITKGSDLRAKAKNAELALGYGGSLGAMKRMGGDKMGMSDAEMMHIVKLWRTSNPSIVELWAEIEACAHEAVRYHRRVVGTPRNLVFDCDDDYFTVQLPSGRKLFYYHPVFKEKKVGKSTKTSKILHYEGLNQETKQWGLIDTYGGKLTENIVQAISRDLIGYAMENLESNGFGITMHVHDEAIAEVHDNGDADKWLDKMINIMKQPPDWASDLPLNAAGFTSPYYQKD